MEALLGQIAYAGVRSTDSMKYRTFVLVLVLEDVQQVARLQLPRQLKYDQNHGFFSCDDTYVLARSSGLQYEFVVA
jgi:hypothetical protein